MDVEETQTSSSHQNPPTDPSVNPTPSSSDNQDGINLDEENNGDSSTLPRLTKGKSNEPNSSKSNSSSKSKRTHKRVMDGFIVDTDGEDDDIEEEEKPKATKKRKPLESLSKPDVDAPDVDDILKAVFGDSDDDTLAHFSDDEENWSDLSDCDEGLVPKAKADIKKLVAYHKRERKIASQKTRKRSSYRDDDSDAEVDESGILPDGARRTRRPVIQADDSHQMSTPSSSSKKKGMSEEEIKERCADLVSRMESAYAEDNANNLIQKPALKKSQMLEEVRMAILRDTWHEALLNAGILVVVRQWLTPLPDKTLPNKTVRESLLRAISTIQDVTKYMLKESKIASLVKFLSEKDPEPSIRTLAADLAQQWSRTLSSGSDSYKILSEVESHRQLKDSKISKSQQVVLSRVASYGRPVQGAISSSAKKIKGPQFAPQPIVSTMDYVKRPESTLDMSTVVKKSASRASGIIRM